MLYTVEVAHYGTITVEAQSVDEAYQKAEPMGYDDVDWFSDFTILRADSQ